MYKRSENTLLSAWLPVVLWCSVIFFFSSLPTVHTPFLVWWDVLLKKTAHITEFAILFILIHRGIRITYGIEKLPNRHIVLSVLVCLIYAISDEIHQRFTPGRTSTIRDVGIDFIGIMLGLWLVGKFQTSNYNIFKIINWGKPR